MAAEPRVELKAKQERGKGIRKNWFKIKSVIMQEWSESRDALIELFGKVRDEWMDTNLTTWIGDNRDIYSHNNSRADFVGAGVTIPPDEVLGTGRKVELLKQLQKKPEHLELRLQ
ncbi:hypothetical protein CUMW_166060 [Citrus unshiu]|nr:hypothetical protein CUMW_166060 [Citrus unshiu]